jgi:hypothetical protein
MDGSIDAGRYTAADGSFSVDIPHPDDSFESRNLQIRDGQDTGETGKVSYVIFGPGPTDPAGYHVIVATPVTPVADDRSLAERAGKIASHYIAEYDREYRGMAERLVFDPVGVGGHSAIYSIYRYEYQAGGVSQGFYVAFTIIKASDDHLVNVMAEKLTETNPWYPGVDALVGRDWARFNDFAASVRVAD